MFSKGKSFKGRLIKIKIAMNNKRTIKGVNSIEDIMQENYLKRSFEKNRRNAKKPKKKRGKVWEKL